MALRPPQHRIDAPIRFIHPSDTAWDRERWDREKDEMRKAGLDPSDHPVDRYLGGFTRYDPDAEATVNGAVVTVNEYIDDAKQPTVWHLKRLTILQWYDVQPMWERDVRAGQSPKKAYVHAATIGVAKVDNGPTLDLTGGKLTTSDLEKLREIGSGIGDDLIVAIGEAVYQASMPLREDERRPLG
jgi:hypothetical protein